MRGHIAKKGNNYYAVIYEGINPSTGKERHRWHRAGPRRLDAERLVNELTRRRHSGEDTSDRSTVGTYLVDRWLPIQESRLRPTTYQSYANTVRLHVVPYIGRVRLGKLQAEDLEALYVDLLRDGRRKGDPGGLSPASVRYVHRVIRKALGDAHRKGIVGRNVAALADPPKAEANGTRATIQVWDTPDLRRFLTETSGHLHHDLWVLAAKTGMRRGELAGLRWSDVDVHAGTVSIRRAVVLVGWSLHVSDAKTASGRRTIDLDDRTVQMLRDRRASRVSLAAEAGQELDRDALVFDRPDGNPIHPEYISRTFDRAVARHHLPRIRFHDIRHTHATLLLKAGVPAKVVAERLGHASAGFTLNVYQHVLPGMQTAAAETFDRLLGDPATHS